MLALQKTSCKRLTSQALTRSLFATMAHQLLIIGRNRQPAQTSGSSCLQVALDATTRPHVPIEPTAWMDFQVSRLIICPPPKIWHLPCNLTAFTRHFRTSRHCGMQTRFGWPTAPLIITWANWADRTRLTKGGIIGSLEDKTFSMPRSSTSWKSKVLAQIRKSRFWCSVEPQPAVAPLSHI